MSILNKIHCTKRLIEFGASEEMISWMSDNKLIDKEKWKTADSSQLRAELVVTSLLKAAELDKLHLVDFEWSVLPIERIKITVVSEREKVEFTYGL
jgi:hypothetical protein